MQCAEERLRESIKLVHFVLHRQFPALAYDQDLFQEGCIGLWHACLRYDAELGAQFSTYACICIKNAILMALRRRRREPPAVSLDAPLEDNDSAFCIGDTLEDPRASAFEIDIFADDVMQRLSEPDQQLIRLLYAGVSQQAVGETLGISPTQVSRRLAKIRALYQKTEGSGGMGERKRGAACKTKCLI